jgi:hypothetical protein
MEIHQAQEEGIILQKVSKSKGNRDISVSFNLNISNQVFLNAYYPIKILFSGY